MLDCLEVWMWVWLSVCLSGIISWGQLGKWHTVTAGTFLTPLISIATYCKTARMQGSHFWLLSSFTMPPWFCISYTDVLSGLPASSKRKGCCNHDTDLSSSRLDIFWQMMSWCLLGPVRVKEIFIWMKLQEIWLTCCWMKKVESVMTGWWRLQQQEWTRGTQRSWSDSVVSVVLDCCDGLMKPDDNSMDSHWPWS